MAANGNGAAAPAQTDDLKALLAQLLGTPGTAPTRYADWDAAIDRRKPIKFRFLGVVWKVKQFDFRALAAALDTATYAGLSDEEATAKMIDFIGEHVTDPAIWKKKTAEGKIALSTMTGGLRWLMVKDAGMPLQIEDSEDPDPLDTSRASSPSVVKNGRPSAGGSRKSASRTP